MRNSRGQEATEVDMLIAEIERLRNVMGTHSTTMHPEYGSCDGLGDGGGCSECLRIKRVAEARTASSIEAGLSIRNIALEEAARLLDRDAEGPSLRASHARASATDIRALKSSPQGRGLGS